MDNIVILAGGGGERLWPLSRKNQPKQCISLDKENTLIQKTYSNACQIVDRKHVFISTRQALANLIIEQIPDAQLIVEPLGRDSAAGIGYVCAYLLKKKNDYVTTFMGADYHIPNLDQFKKVLKTATELGKKDKIATLGITPNRPETGFGYIEPGEPITGLPGMAYEVKAFKEKPSESVAISYIEKGFLWNSGMFIVKPSVLYKNFQEHMPNLFEGLESIRSTNFDNEIATKVFETLSKISIDFGVMEKTEDLVVVKGDFDWDDIGTWDSLDRILDQDENGNIIQSEFLGIETKNNIIYGEKPIIGFGIKNLVVIDTNDCTFICPKSKAPEIKQLIRKLEENPDLRYLLNY
ncbi:MAG: mannose-1-phosphate guanylyltransferase [Candidatus Hodarchaeales archaeon]|jgi:mannose-1-phosphate guanylyltransferase